MQRLARLACVCATLASLDASAASDDEWLRLQAPSFGMVSQLSENITRQRAKEFNQFVESLRHLYTIDEARLPPLTIVLFERERDFAPYRYQTESGQSEDVSGFFGNAEYWSVIGMYGRNSSENTRRTIYHEATHWLLSTNQIDSPLWFKEGIAEVFSTFNVKNGRAEWGLPLENHIYYLNTVGLQPMGEFLRATQDEALHELDTYYPQAWAFVHFLLYGNGGSRRAQLQQFLDELRTVPLDTAFQNTFDMSYEDMDDALRRYLRGGKFVYQQVDAPPDPPESEMDVAAASYGSVEFALARLAVIGGNHDIGLAHAGNLVARLGERPEGYEILAHALARIEDEAGLTAAVDAAIARGSIDANVLLLKAQTMFNANLREGAMWPDEALPPDVARQVADYYSQALRIKLDNEAAMTGLVRALLSARTVSESDAQLLDSLAAIFPTDGTPLIGKALLAHLGKDEKIANALLTSANVEPRRLPQDLRAIVRAVQQRWYIDWLRTNVEAMVAEERFADARVWLDEQAADTALTDDQRKALDVFRTDMIGFEAIAATQALVEAGRVDEAKERLRAIANDPAYNSNIKSAARRVLNFLNR